MGLNEGPRLSPRSIPVRILSRIGPLKPCLRYAATKRDGPLDETV